VIRGPRRWAAALGGLALLAVALFMARENLCRPKWSLYWSNCPPGGISSAAGLKLSELGRLGSPANTSRSGGGVQREDGPKPWELPTPDFFPGLYGEIRAREQLGHQEALRAYSAYLASISARRLNAERLRWEEMYRDRALQLAEEGERQLQAYMDAIRDEYYGTISSLEMQIALVENRMVVEDLEGKLIATKAEIEAKIAQRREDLARECALQLGVLQAQARDALTRLEAKLEEETRRALAAFVSAEEERYRQWLARNRQSEADLKSSN